MKDLFLKIESKSTLSALLLGYSFKVGNWTTRNGFLMAAVPDMMLNFDPFLSNLKNTFNGDAVIFKMSPNSFYKFHVDEKRQSAINLLLDGFDSNFYFGKQGASEEVIESVVEAKYEPDTYYLVNTKEKHAVLNRSQTRFVLSLGFENCDFATIRDYAIENMLIR